MEKAGQFCFTHPSGKDIYLYSLRNANGTEVLITNYGAIIKAYKIQMPGSPANDIVLGFDDVHEYLKADYLEVYPFMGAAIGRYLQLKYLSQDGEEGFPGNLDVNICFELNDDNDLIYEYTASCDQPTAVNLTHHSYFNLNYGEGTITDHEVKINSDKILEQDENLVTTGNYIAVDNTKYDFSEFHPIGERMNEGYNQSFVIDKKADQLTIVAEVQSKKSGVKLQVLTTEPLVHLYTGQGFPKLKGKNNIEYGPFSGVCLETQKHPNAINIPKFFNTVLRPGEKYHQKNVYKICKL